MAAIERIDDHAEQGELLLLEQYQNKPRLRGLLLSYLNRVQELEDAIWDVIIKRLIENAQDAQLDTIGKIAGEERKGRTDAIYRLWITARIAINKSHGHPADVINVLRIVETTPFLYREFYPATVLIEFLDVLTGPAQDLHDVAEETAAAGVRVDVVYSETFAADNMFSFSTVAEAGEADSARGFGLTDSSTGGRFAQVIT